MHLHLTSGSTHETDPSDPDRYQISTFQQTDIPIAVRQNESKDQEPTPVGELRTSDLPVQAQHTNKISARWYWIEYNRRFALPTSCLVLALVGIPLGLSSKKGGKSAGFVLTILLVLAYYSVTLIGVSLARQGKVSPATGAWLANVVFFVSGALLLWRAERRPIELSASHFKWNPFPAAWLERGRRMFRSRPEDAFERAAARRRVFSARFPIILDDYILRDFFLYLAMILASFIVLLLVFTVFELLTDILRNHISPLVVGDYLLNVTPFFLYNITHLCVLLAVLVTFGLLQRSNELTAIKATGISIYRVIVPVLLAAMLLAGGLFAFDQFYLPRANRRQDALRNLIKGKPPQTYLNPDRKWIFGENSTIYYYQVFDPDRNQFGSLTAFQFDPATFQLVARVYADRAHWEERLHRWVCTQGWERDFRGAAIAGYRTFDVATFSAINEPPGYFKKEVRQSSEMNYEQLRRYILGPATKRIRRGAIKVQLQEKIAFPLSALVMAVLAVPFSLSSGKRGALAGVATAVGIAVVYITLSRLSESMGNVSQLPPLLAAWAPEIIFALAGGYLILRVPT